MGETWGQTGRFPILFEKTRFARNDWRFSEWGKLPVCSRLSPASTASKIIIVWATSAAEPTVILIRNL